MTLKKKYDQLLKEYKYDVVYQKKELLEKQRENEDRIHELEDQLDICKKQVRWKANSAFCFLIIFQLRYQFSPILF